MYKYSFIFHISFLYTLADIQQNYRSDTIILCGMVEKEFLYWDMGALFDEFHCNNTHGCNSNKCFIINKSHISSFSRRLKGSDKNRIFRTSYKVFFLFECTVHRNLQCLKPNVSFCKLVRCIVVDYF